MNVKPLKLIAVDAGRAKDFFWISMDGAEESCNPQSFIKTFPEFCESVVVLDDLSELKCGAWFGITVGNKMQEAISDVVAKHIGDAELCLVDSYELFTFTRSENLHRRMLPKVLDCL